MKTRIIGFSGKMGAGKTTCAEILSGLMRDDRTKSYYPKVLKFAGPLYDIQNYIYERTGLEKPVKDRKLLQFIGADWGREKNPNLWLDIWRKEARVYMFKSHDHVVICDDVRYDNEADLILAMGGTLINVDAPDELRGERIKLENTGHSSEAGIDSSKFNLSIYNGGTTEGLIANIRYLYTSIL